MRIPHPFVESSHKLFIYNYDKIFVKAIDHFHDNMARIMKRHNYTGDFQAHEYFEQDLLVELLIDKLRDEHEHEEVIVEGVYEDFDTRLADDMVDELTNWINMGTYPYGLREIIRQIPEECYLVDITFDEDSDGTYYSFDSSEG